MLTLQEKGKSLTGQQELYSTAVIDKIEKQLIVKIVNTSEKKQSVVISQQGIKKLIPQASLVVLSSQDRNAVNSLETPLAVSPVEKSIPVNGKKVELSLDPLSVTIIRLPYRE